MRTVWSLPNYQIIHLDYLPVSTETANVQLAVLFELSTNVYVTLVTPRGNSVAGSCDRIFSGIPDRSDTPGSVQLTWVPFLPSSIIVSISSGQYDMVGDAVSTKNT